MFRKTRHTLLLLLLPAFTASAQDNTVDMADALRSSGKIYVVVAVLSIIFAGLVVYLVRLDRRITRMEKEKGTGGQLQR
jgi:CcmD family protein